MLCYAFKLLVYSRFHWSKPGNKWGPNINCYLVHGADEGQYMQTHFNEDIESIRFSK